MPNNTVLLTPGDYNETTPPPSSTVNTPFVTKSWNGNNSAEGATLRRDEYLPKSKDTRIDAATRFYSISYSIG